MSDDRDRSRSRSRSPDRSRGRDHDQGGPPSSAPANGAPDSNGDASGPVKLYIGNIDYGTDDVRLRDAFTKFGTITDAFVPMERGTQRPRGFGFVTFETREQAMNAMKDLDGTELDGRTIRISESRPRSTATGPFNASGKEDVKLFVGNLSFDTETEKIRELFSSIGEVKDCYMPTDREQNRPRGFAFVTMSAGDAEEAMKKLTGQDIDGRSIRIEEAGGKSARPRDDFRGGGGGYGGDRGGGGGGYGGGGDRYGGGGGGDRGGYSGGGDRYDRGGGRGSRDYGDSRRDDRGYGDSRDSRRNDRYDRDRDDRRHDDRGRDSHKSRDYDDRGYDDRGDSRRSKDYDRDERYDRDRGDSRSHREDRGDSRRNDSY